MPQRAPVNDILLCMSSPPRTSITLLKDLAQGSANARWAEFVARYDGLMRGFLRSRFPDLEADDILQNAFVSLVKAIPEYRYTPDERGFFRDYVIGVVRHKALDAARKRGAEAEKRRGYKSERDCHGTSQADASWREALMNAALEQLMADSSIATRNREIFRHVALLGEPPERVAADFGVSRGNVDVIKKRMIDRLRSLVASMSKNG